jgi:acyl-coenzyme A thioesterase PaaI-like protein
MPYVTAGLEVAYLRPTPLGGLVRLTATIADAGAAELVAEIEVSSGGKTCSAGRVRWKRLRVR